MLVLKLQTKIALFHLDEIVVDDICLHTKGSGVTAPLLYF